MIDTNVVLNHILEMLTSARNRYNVSSRRKATIEVDSTTEDTEVVAYLTTVDGVCPVTVSGEVLVSKIVLRIPPLGSITVKVFNISFDGGMFVYIDTIIYGKYSKHTGIKCCTNYHEMIKDYYRRLNTVLRLIKPLQKK